MFELSKSIVCGSFSLSSFIVLSSFDLVTHTNRNKHKRNHYQTLIINLLGGLICYIIYIMLSQPLPYPITVVSTAISLFLGVGTTILIFLPNRFFNSRIPKFFACILKEFVCLQEADDLFLWDG